MAKKGQRAAKGRVLPILQYENEAERLILRKKCEPVGRINREIRQLADDLLATMYAADGLGLAAPQIGVLRRVIAVDVGDGPTVLINPELLDSEGEDESFEGCLSIPGMQGKVTRATKVRLTGLNPRGRRVWVEAEGLEARAFQHELDHLDGILFLDRSEKLIHLTPETELRLVYMGTPEFAVQPLDDLIDGYFNLQAVVTQPDRPQGRGQKVQPSPVKQAAQEVGVPLLQPQSASETEFVAQLVDLAPDVIITCAYGLLLPPEVLAIPRLGCLNIHPSLLPKLRGAAPIQRAVMAGHTETGVSIYFMDEGLDTGDILLQRAVPIAPDEDAGQLAQRLSRLSGEMIQEALALLVAEEEPPRRRQDDDQATYAPVLKPIDERLDWQWPAEKIVNHVRGLAPQPGAYTLFNGQRLKILQAKMVPPADYAGYGLPTQEEEKGAGGTGGYTPGSVIAVPRGEGFILAAGQGAVLVQKVQLAGRGPVSGHDFVNGQQLTVGTLLGTEAAGAQA